MQSDVHKERSLYVECKNPDFQVSGDAWDLEREVIGTESAVPCWWVYSVPVSCSTSAVATWVASSNVYDSQSHLIGTLWGLDVENGSTPGRCSA